MVLIWRSVHSLTNLSQIFILQIFFCIFILIKKFDSFYLIFFLWVKLQFTNDDDPKDMKEKSYWKINQNIYGKETNAEKTKWFSLFTLCKSRSTFFLYFKSKMDSWKWMDRTKCVLCVLCSSNTLSMQLLLLLGFCCCMHHKWLFCGFEYRVKWYQFYR